MARPVIWMDSLAYEETRASLMTWATLIGPFEQPERPWVETLRPADGAIVTANRRFDGAVLAQAKRLQVIARLGVGLDNVDVAAATAAGICVTNAPGASTISVAEHTVALLLGLSHLVRFSDHLVRQGQWEARQGLSCIELRDKVLGVIGLGRIGTLTARMCGMGLGMRVLAYDPHLDEATVRQRHAEPVPRLEELIALSEAITLHVPMTPQTERMINARTLAHARPDALLVNTARGAIVDTQDLVEALRSGRLGGAALDVVDPEPMRPGHPLLDLPNVIITPHLGGASAEARARVGAQAEEGIRRVLQGEQPLNTVNPEVWKRRRGAHQEHPGGLP
jgi:D-3-phosphoglycerate dehydrogenase